MSIVISPIRYQTRIIEIKVVKMIRIGIEIGLYRDLYNSRDNIGKYRYREYFTGNPFSDKITARHNKQVSAKIYDFLDVLFE